MSFSNIEIQISERDRRALVVRYLADILSGASRSVLADGLPPESVDDDGSFIKATDAAIIDSLINETLLTALQQHIVESEIQENDKRQLKLDL